MPIGPSGERLPYPGEGGPPTGNPMGARAGIQPVGNPMGAQAGVSPDVLIQELSALTQRAQQIMGELQAMGVDPMQVIGGGAPPGAHPQMAGGAPPGLLPA